MNKENTVQETLFALQVIIKNVATHVTEEQKYGMPFFVYRGRMFCYLWTDKKTKEPYIGFVQGNRMDHPKLEKGNRSRMKIYRVNSAIDIPVEEIKSLLNVALDFYRNGIIKTKF